MPRSLTWLLIATLLLTLVSCKEVDGDVVTDVGLTQLFLVDSSLAPQSVTDPESTVQVTSWTLQQGQLQIDGVPIDLLYGSPCGFRNTVRVFGSIAIGSCAQGFIVGGNTISSLVLTLSFTMQLRRATPVSLAPMADFDADTVLNQSDNCPLIPNLDQMDAEMDGIGDVCSIDVGSGPERDSDADGIPDRSDNCVWISNPLQTDKMGLAAEGIPDGIGDACGLEQEAEVRAAGNPNITVSLPVPFLQPSGTTSLLAVDFGDALSGCDWTAGSCNIDTTRVKFCPTTSFVVASLGCP